MEVSRLDVQWDFQEDFRNQQQPGRGLWDALECLWLMPQQAKAVAVAGGELKLVTTAAFIQESQVFHRRISPTKHPWKVLEHSTRRWEEWGGRAWGGDARAQGVWRLLPAQCDDIGREASKAAHTQKEHSNASNTYSGIIDSNCGGSTEQVATRWDITDMLHDTGHKC